MKPEVICGTFLGATFTVITFDQGSNLMDGSFPIPLPFYKCCQADKYDIGCIAGKSHRRLWERWCDRELSGRWTGLTQFTALSETPNGYTFSVRHLTKVQATSKPCYLWPEVLVKYVETLSTEGITALDEGKAEAR